MTGLLGTAGARAAATVVRETCGLLVPLECPCGAPGRLLCADCAELLERRPQRVDAACDALQLVAAARVREQGDAAPAGVDHEPLLPVMALGEYAGPLQDLVLAWKNGGRAHLVPALARALAPAVLALAAAHRDQADGAAAVLVPVPSRLGSRLRRGDDHTAHLAAVLSRRTGLRWERLAARLGEGQQGRSARQRRTRHLHLGPGALPRSRRTGAPVILVDDVVTTGATLRASAEGIAAAGVPVIGAAVIASARIPATRATP
jgi:predicted amidophosphoribosyltransferase